MAFEGEKRKIYGEENLLSVWNNIHEIEDVHPPWEMYSASQWEEDGDEDNFTVSHNTHTSSKQIVMIVLWLDWTLYTFDCV